MPVATQTWADHSSILSLGQLSKEFRVKSQPKKAFDQACEAPAGKALGKGRGDTVYYNFVKDVNTEGGVLSENEVVPTTSFTTVRTSFSVSEFGNAIDFTDKLETLDELGIEHARVQALMNDWEKVRNTQAYNQFVLTDWKAAFIAAGDEFVTGGTLSGTADQDLSAANMDFVVQKAKINHIPFYDGESYLYITGVTASHSFQYDSDIMDVLKYDSGRSALNGEVGRARKVRLVEDSHKIAKSTGTLDEGFLIGADAVGTDIARDLELTMDIQDGGRFKKLMYTYIGAWYKILDQTDHGVEHIIHVSSA